MTGFLDNKAALPLNLEQLRTNGFLSFTKQKFIWKLTITFGILLLPIWYHLKSSFLVVGPSVISSSHSGPSPTFQVVSPWDQTNMTSDDKFDWFHGNRGFFHLLMPASKLDTHLCKAVLSAAVLNYSTPILLNYNKPKPKRELSKRLALSSHLAKVTGTSSYLDKLGPEHDDDLVVMVDGYDIWFQLRPETLISRYYAINKRANERISQDLCRKSSCQEYEHLKHVKQTIVINAEKRCWPQQPELMTCYMAPPSDLPADIYGTDTDKIWSDTDFPYAKMRQRYLNSGFVMGPVRDMRKFFTAAKKQMVIDNHGGSDQGVMGEVWGLQEYTRGMLREKHLGLPPNLERGVMDTADREDVNARRALETLWPRPDVTNITAMQEFEFGVGIDYWGELSFPTANAQRDADWVRWDKPEEPSQWYHVRLPEILKKGLPPDLKLAPSVQNTSIQPFNWTSTPLYTNMYTGVVPAIIHHNAGQNGLKANRDKLWKYMWFVKAAKEMLQAHTTSPRMPVAIEISQQGQKAWWSPIEQKGGVEADSGGWSSWDEICGKAWPVLQTPG